MFINDNNITIEVQGNVQGCLYDTVFDLWTGVRAHEGKALCWVSFATALEENNNVGGGLSQHGKACVFGIF